jgi:CDP-paratose 2-epimerase
MHAELRSTSWPENTADKTVGLIEWLRPEEYARLERLLADCQVLGIKVIRTAVSWADWHTRAGQGWYAWLLPRLAAEVEFLPCFLYTPPSLGVEPKTAAPPATPRHTPISSTR